MAKKVTLDWTDPSPTTYVNQLEIWRKLDGGTYAHIGGAQLGDETYDDESGVVDITKYYYEVRAYNIDRKYSAIENNITITGFLLDKFPGAEAAYSLRKLKTGITYGIEIRRDVGSPTTTGVQVYDNGDNIDLNSTVAAGGTLGTWIGANSAYIKTWYDQSGNGNDATQTTDADQPRIVNTGTLEVENSLSSLNFLGAQELDLTSSVYNNPMTVFSVWNMNTLSEATVYNLGNGTTSVSSLSFNRTSGIVVNVNYYGSTINKSIAYSQNTQYITTDLTIESSSNKLYLNNNVDTGFASGRSAFVDNVIGSRSGIYYHTGTIQEIVIYQSDKSSDRTAIETDMNDHYSIY